ncbi:MAG TPA: MlaD family protein [Actinomycetota bacterium]|nr:MlaD family protein [Actinomycetota bacterium]
MNNPLVRRLIAFGFMGVLGVGLYFGVKARYGSYDEVYHVSAVLPRAGQLMRVGADVQENGVVIGTVTAMRLRGRQVELVLELQPRYRVPASARAVIELKTLLGDKFVDLRFDEYAPPFLEDGDRIQGDVGPELEDVLQVGVDVFGAIEADDLATIVGELARGARGHGDDVARGLETGAELSTIFRETLDPQLRSLRDFRILFEALDDRADDLNALADAVNEGVPVYASERAQQDLRRVLDALVPFAHHLADLLIFERDDWDRMMDRGDVVLQTIAERPGDLHDLVHGLYRYVFKLGQEPPFLDDRTAAAPFANFIGGEEEGGEAEFAAAIRAFCAELPPGTADDILACEAAG